MSIVLRSAGETPGDATGARMRALHYDIMCNGQKVGTCELRPEATWAARWSGQIAYTVYPPFRGHHYALRAVRLLCAEARRLGRKTLTVTCRPDNAASVRTLLLAGAVFEASETVPEDHPLRRSGCREVSIYSLNTTDSE